MQDSILVGFPRDLLKGTCKRSCEDLLEGFSRISTTPAQNNLCKRGFHKNLYRIFSQGPVQDHAREDFTRISTRSSREDYRFVRA